MRFKIDENLPQEVAEILRETGHDAVSVFDQMLTGESDQTVFEVCQSESRVLMTLDLDFANIHAYPPTEAPGIVVLRLARQDKPRVLEVVRALAPAFEMNEISRKLWIVEDDRIRIRS